MQATFNRSALLVVALVLLFVHNVRPANILGYLVTPGRSHFIIHDSLLRGLAEKGHNVTVVGIWPPRLPMPATYRYIHLEMSPENKLLLDESKKHMIGQAENNTFDFMKLPERLSAFMKMSVDYMQRPEIERIKREDKYDLVVVGYFVNDFNLGIAGHFKCPSVIISGTPAIAPLRDLVGMPSSVAYVQYALFPSAVKVMSFKDRVLNYLTQTVEWMVITLFEHCYFQPYYELLFPPNQYPSLNEVRKNVSLVMVSAHVSQGNSPATMPSLLEVSGIHIKAKPDPLPKKIKDWLDGAKDGAIYFSFGTNIESSLMSDEKRTMILTALAKLKQRVLWKYENENLPNKPANVMIEKWLPQDDILAHPNVRLFISHCGKGSVNEAKYHGVPILGIPMFGDQMGNLKVIEKEGWAVARDFSTLTEENLSEGLAEILNNASFSKVVKTAANLYRDRPQHPLELAVFWVEYVLRHNGAKHLQSQAVHMNWFQLQSYDVLASIFLALYVVWRVLKFGFLFVVGLCFKRSKKSKKD